MCNSVPSSSVPSSSSSSPTPVRRLRRAAVSALLLGGAGLLAACGTPSTPAPAAAAQTTASAPAQHAHDVSIDSGWVKAGSGMTAAFGTITNGSGHDVHIVKGTSDRAGLVQLHTMEQQADGSMKMTEKKGGFVVPAGGSLTLSPGGDHIMLMDLPSVLSNGQQVGIRLLADDGETFSWSLPVRAFAGADETYAPGGTGTSLPDMSGMSTTTSAP